MTTPTEQRRAEFEKWAATEDRLRWYHIEYDSTQEKFLWADVQTAWVAWQAAADLYERRGLERAREICKRRSVEYGRLLKEPERYTEAIACADAIEREINGKP